MKSVDRKENKTNRNSNYKTKNFLMKVRVFWKLRLTIRTLVNRTESSYRSDQDREEGKDACKSVGMRSDAPRSE